QVIAIAFMFCFSAQSLASGTADEDVVVDYCEDYQKHVNSGGGFYDYPYAERVVDYAKMAQKAGLTGLLGSILATAFVRGDRQGFVVLAAATVSGLTWVVGYEVSNWYAHLVDSAKRRAKCQALGRLSEYPRVPKVPL